MANKIKTVNLGEAIRIAQEKNKREPKNPHQKNYRTKKQEIPEWKKTQLWKQNERRKNK